MFWYSELMGLSQNGRYYTLLYIMKYRYTPHYCRPYQSIVKRWPSKGVLMTFFSLSTHFWLSDASWAKRIPGYPRIPGSSQSSHFWWWKRRNHTITRGFRGDVVKIFPAKHRFHRFLFSKLRSFSNHMLPVKSPVDRLHIMSEQYVICFK